uniref:CSON010777 protein n=1 Tax=Culicoides sonorensis TaxID=179676 RepID=A0A336MEC1_CULSO
MPVSTAPAPVVNGNHSEHDNDQQQDFGQLVGDNYEFQFIKKIDGDIKLDSSPETSPKKITPETLDVFDTLETHAGKQLKLNDGKPKKILRMSIEDLDEKRHEKMNVTKKRWPSYKIFLILLAVSGVVFGVLCHELRDQLLRHYRKEYNILIHGQEYCTDQIDYTSLGKILRNEIVGQEAALTELENALKTHQTFSSIILHGPTGTGKTLTTQLLATNFRWQENTQVLVYNPNAKFDLTSITRRLSSCGHNLIIIDDLHLINKDLLTLRQSIEEIAREKNFKVVLIFVFNMSKFETQRNVDGEGPIFEHLPTNAFRIIEYKHMTDIDLNKCMDKIEKELALTLSHEQRANVKQSVDVTKSGCKNVKSKISLYS